jgi:hypothetical protein
VARFSCDALPVEHCPQVVLFGEAVEQRPDLASERSLDIRYRIVADVHHALWRDLHATGDLEEELLGLPDPEVG